jgi:hypothetical protein
LENLKGRNHFKLLSTDERIILKWIYIHSVYSGDGILDCRNTEWWHTSVNMLIFRICNREFLQLSNNYEGHAVAYLVEALCYKLKGHGFDS